MGHEDQEGAVLWKRGDPLVVGDMSIDMSPYSSRQPSCDGFLDGLSNNVHNSVVSHTKKDTTSLYDEEVNTPTKKKEKGSDTATKNIKTSYKFFEKEQKQDEKYKNTKIGLVGSVNGTQSILARSLIYRSSGTQDVRFSMRATVGTPGPGSRIRTLFAYILAECPYGTPECNMAIDGTRNLVSLCETCYGSCKNNFTAMKCIVDKYVKSDPMLPQGMFDSDVNVNVQGMTAISAVISNLARSLQNGHFKVEHSINPESLPESLKGSSIGVAHSVDMENIREAFDNVNVNHNISFGKAKDIFGEDYGVTGNQIIVTYMMFGMTVFVAYKAYKTRERAWCLMLGAMLSADILAAGVNSVANTTTDSAIRNSIRMMAGGPPPSDKWQEQADITDVFSTGLMSYMYAKVIAGMETGISFEEFMQKTINFPKRKQSLDFTIDFVVDLVQRAITVTCDYMGVEERRLKADPCPEATQWLKEVRVLINDFEQSMELDWTLFNRVTELRKTASEIMNKIERRRDLDRVRRFMDESLSDLGKILGRLQRAGVVASGPRIEPVGVLISGAPGVGKTTSSHNMMLAVTAQIIDECDEERFLENHNDFIYNRISEEEFFTGYHGQTVFYFDDIGVNVDVAGTNASPFMEAIRAINSNNYLMHMADLPDKGTQVFRSKVVWATSNRICFSGNMQSLYEEGAFTRRWTPFLCAPKLEYSTIETQSGEIKNRKLDENKVDHLDSSYPHLEWYPLNLKTGAITTPGLSFKEAVSKIVSIYRYKNGFGRKLLDDNERTKREALLRRKLARGEFPQWEAQANVDEIIAKEVDRQMEERARKNQKGKEPMEILPEGLAPDKVWLYKYMRMFWPDEKTSDVMVWANGAKFNPTDCYDSDDPRGSSEKFELMVRGYVHQIRDKPFKEKLSERFNERSKSWSEWWSQRDNGKLKKLGAASAALAGLAALVTLGRYFVSEKEDSASDSDESSYAQSYSQRTRPRVHQKVKPLRARKGRGHIQRVKGRDYSMQAGDDIIRQLVWQAQSGFDKQTQDIIMKVATRSQYRVYSKYSTKGYGYITMLKGHIAIAPKHFMCIWREQEEKEKGLNGTDTKFVLTFTRMGAKQVSKEVAIDDISFFDPEDMGDRDIIFMLMPDYFNPGPDIVKHFLREAELPKSKFEGAILLEREDVKILPIMSMQYHQGFTYPVDNNQTEFWSNPDAIEYRFPTQNGDCGSWISVTEQTTGCRKLVGFHVAGRAHSANGSGLALTQEELVDIIDEICECEGISSVVEEWEPQAGEPEPVLPTEQFNTIELADKRCPVASQTAIVPSPLAKDLESMFVAPALLHKMKGNQGDIIDPWLNSRRKYNLPVRYVDISFLAMCTQSYTAKVFNVSTEEYSNAKRVYTFEEAVEGLQGTPNFNGIPRNTSPGYPWCTEIPKGFSGKKHLFGEEGDYDYSSPQCKMLRKRVETVVSKAAQGKRLKHVYADFLKDETLPIEKVKTGKTRLISAAPVDFTICIRMYFGDFTRWYLNNNVKNGSGVGVNVYGPDWTRVVRYLSASDQVKNLIAGDFKSYDGSLSRAIQLEFLYLVEKYYFPSDPTNAEAMTEYHKDMTIRKVLFEDIINSKHIIESSIYEWSSSMPSGNPLTTVLNTVCNNILIRYASMLSYSLSLGSKQPFPVLSVVQAAQFMEMFELDVRIIAYGDDNVISVGDKVMKYVDQQQLTNAFSKFGFQYVDESKKDVQYTFRSLNEVMFLKRGFVKDPTEDCYVAPLVLETILEVPRWSKRGERYQEIVRSNIDTSLRELSLHNKKVFDKHAVKNTGRIKG